MFMATLDNQIVSTALPTIVGEFGHLERFGWIGSSYLLASSAVMPIYGKLGDLFGRKYVMMTAIAIFTIGSAVCGLAVSMNTLIAARVLQGLGGGGIMVSIFSINADLFEPRERARYQSYSSLVLMASGAIGPVLGGTMSDLFGWRSIFLVNIPVGIIVLTGLFTMLALPASLTRKPKIDYAGAISARAPDHKQHRACGRQLRAVRFDSIRSRSVAVSLPFGMRVRHRVGCSLNVAQSEPDRAANAFPAVRPSALLLVISITSGADRLSAWSIISRCSCRRRRG